MKLTDIERHNPIWVKIEAFLKERLDILRQSNDGDKDAIETATLRGSIKEVKKLLDIGQPLPGKS